MLPPPTVIWMRRESGLWGLISATMWICATTMLDGTALHGMKNMAFVPFMCCLKPCANCPNSLQVDRLHCGPYWSGKFPSIRYFIVASFTVEEWMTVLAW